MKSFIYRSRKTFKSENGKNYSFLDRITEAEWVQLPAAEQPHFNKEEYKEGMKLKKHPTKVKQAPNDDKSLPAELTMKPFPDASNL